MAAALNREERHTAGQGARRPPSNRIEQPTLARLTVGANQPAGFSLIARTPVAAGFAAFGMVRAAREVSAAQPALAILIVAGEPS
ncbi:hypothetical protein ACFQ3P_18575 [Paraburkholderia sabiae]|uniref:Uncharacterized protein n=1 Tax=Paraburkholderia sabiae TaxID=273251 RepID=A0ABU9QAM1_9BURK|nr:hypothetical protein [Paraburkholderia sabiae]WJZ72543.1 hypothetical protein QEN71_20550 [Paraburkholderia sabiae]